MSLRAYAALVVFMLACFALVFLASPAVASWAVIAGCAAAAAGVVTLVTRGLRG